MSKDEPIFTLDNTQDAPIHHGLHGEPEVQKKTGRIMIYCRERNCNMFVVGPDMQTAVNKWNLQVEDLKKHSTYQREPHKT